MWEQAKALQEGAEIVVCTPVRALVDNHCGRLCLVFMYWRKIIPCGHFTYWVVYVVVHTGSSD